MMQKAVTCGSWDTMEWLVYLKMPLTMKYIGMCLYYDRYDMITVANIECLYYKMDYLWIDWIWNNCSATALQWCLVNCTNARQHLTKVSLERATLIKLSVLKEFNVWLGQRKQPGTAR